MQDEVKENIVREMSLDNTYAQYPSNLTREWSIAQAHLIYQEEKGVDEAARFDDI